MSNNFTNLLDEKNPIWIKIFKILVIVTAAVILVGGIILSLVTTTSKHDGVVSFDFLIFILCFVGSCVAAFTELVSGMLIVNYLNNVQTICKKVSELKD